MCQAGNTSYCSYGEQYPAEVASFVATSLVGGATAEAYVLGGGLAATTESVEWNAGVACLKNAVCRLLTGAVGGAAVTQLPNRLARVTLVNVFETATRLGRQPPQTFLSPPQMT